MAKAPSYKGLAPASEKASHTARGASKKTDTKPEVAVEENLETRAFFDYADLRQVRAPVERALVRRHHD